MVRRCVRSRNLVNEGALAHVGGGCAKLKKKVYFNHNFMERDSAHFLQKKVSKKQEKYYQRRYSTLKH